MTTKTTEEKLFGCAPDEDSALFRVQPDEDASAALDNASTFIDCAQRGLEQMAQAEGAHNDALLWSLSYTLRLAKGLVDSVNNGMLKERPLRAVA